MSNYPFKLRLRKLGGHVVLEELAPSRSGAYFLKEQIVLPGTTMLEALEAAVSSGALTLTPGGSSLVKTDTDDLPPIGG